MKHLFTRMAAYNRWANRRLYAAVEALPEGDYARDLGAFFRSIQGTLNHLLVADTIWMERLTGERFVAVTRLDDMPFPALADLDRAREGLDARIIAHVDTLDTAALEGETAYRTVAGAPMRSIRADVLQHLFNHQTHHRGQVHDMLSRLGQEPPPLDLLYYQRELAQGDGR